MQLSCPEPLCICYNIAMCTSTCSFSYATDEAYIELTSISIASLLTHNQGATIILLADLVKAESLDKLRAMVQRLRGTLQVINVSDELKHLKSIGANTHLTISTYARLLIPKLIKDDRTIYLDSDTLIVGSLTSLANLDLHGKAFAIGYDCQRVEYKRYIKLPSSSAYFNAGVMLFDCHAWNEQNCTERLLAAIPKRSAMEIFADQDLITRHLADDAAIFHPKYNFLTHFLMFRSQRDILRMSGIPAELWYSPDEYAEAQHEPIVYHFLGNTLGRPWYRESKNPLRPLYRKYAEIAGIGDFCNKSRPLERYYLLQWLLWKLLPSALFVEACRVMYRLFFKLRYKV